MLKAVGLKKALKKRSYLFVFSLAFLIMLVSMIPILIANGGIFVYYGDYNSQQIPFYMHSHDMVRNFNFGWDWGTDLGTSFVGSYSFYLLGSPFFWLTVPFPAQAIPYLMPIILCLKTGVAALTSYAFIKRFIKGNNACIIGALLYALSGFQTYNVFFNHFHDVVAFFPLLLLALEMTVNDNRRGVFAIAVAFCAIVNYYFFVAEVVFVIIYFCIRCLDKNFNITVKKLGIIIFESIIGFVISLFLVLPSVLAIIDNPRVDKSLLGIDMVVYSDKLRIIRIIQSFFMLPDPPARSNLFNASTARWASIAGYLPMFSLAGVIAVIKAKKGHWTKRLFIVCTIFAFVPVLNSAFQLFNSTYYARWFFMPILITCLMTAYAIDNVKVDLREGAPYCIIAVLVFLWISFLPIEEDGKKVYGKLMEYKDLFNIQALVTVVCTIGLIYVSYIAIKEKGNSNKILTLTVIACLICNASIILYGASQGPIINEYRDEAIRAGEEITIPRPSENDFFRIDISESRDNYPMFWGFSSMRTFHSIVSNSTIEFYEAAGITRDVASRVEAARYPLRNLFSVKYYFHAKTTKEVEMTGFELIASENNYNIYENKNFIPMGFTYDYYTRNVDIESKKNVFYDKILMKAIILDDKQIAKYSDIIEPLQESDLENLTVLNDFYNDCQDRQKSAGSEFSYSSKGFESKITLSKDNLVFYSVPFSDGWSAKVNGVSADVEKVTNGFMAVKANAGENTIVFEYKTPGATQGMIASIIGIIVFVGYMIYVKKRCPKPVKANLIDYDTSYEDDDYSFKYLDSFELERKNSEKTD